MTTATRTKGRHKARKKKSCVTGRHGDGSACQAACDVIASQVIGSFGPLLWRLTRLDILDLSQTPSLSREPGGLAHETDEGNPAPFRLPPQLVNHLSCVSPVSHPVPSPCQPSPPAPGSACSCSFRFRYGSIHGSCSLTANQLGLLSPFLRCSFTGVHCHLPVGLRSPSLRFHGCLGPGGGMDCLFVASVV